MFEWNSNQEQAKRLLGGPARHILLYGGARSGKTYLLLWAMIMRALAVRSRHLVARYRFNAVKQSIVMDTLPSVMENHFPGVPWKVNKEDYYLALPNGSEIWFGGLDEKERTEKILGNEYAGIFLNECSQIPWTAISTVRTRLAQKTEIIPETGEPLRLKMYYDENPPSKGHWTYREFMEKRHYEKRVPLKDPERYASFGPMNPMDNIRNLGADYIAELDDMPLKARKRYRDGLFADESENALWSVELCESCRFTESELPDMQRVVVAVDPSGTKGPEDERSDEVGIVVCGIGTDGLGYVLEDLSGRMGPAEWGKAATRAYERHEADCIVAETNFGGAMVQQVIRTARPMTPFREVKATRGKIIRAEPISALFEQKKVKFVGEFPELEDQLCAFTTAGYIGPGSPDRADAMVWGLTHLFPGIAKNREEGRFRPLRAVLGYANTKRKWG
jgi:predicted phage terminase large subunit-like protein